MCKNSLVCALFVAITTACAGSETSQAGPRAATVGTTQETPATEADSEDASASAEATDRPRGPTQLVRCLPPPATEAELVVPDAPSRVIRLEREVTSALRANPDKIQRLLAAHPQGPLPYRPWMGVTRQEYEELQRLLAAAHTWGQRTIATAKFGVTVTDGRAVFSARGDLEPLDGVRINLETMRVDTPAGTMANPERLRSTGAAGRLDGFHWSRDADAVSLDIALVRSTNRCFLQFGAGETTATGSTLALRYPRND